MRNERMAVNSGLADLLSLRGMEEFDVAPVVITDDQTLGPFPGFSRWFIGGAIAAGVGTYPTIAFQNTGQGMLVLEELAGVANAGGNLVAGLYKEATAIATYTLLISNVLLGVGSNTVDTPSLANVSYQTLATAAGLGSNVVAPNQAANTLMTAKVGWILPPRAVAVFRTDVQQCSLWFAAKGRYYDAA